jgi:2-phosphoglycerate kinase
MSAPPPFTVALIGGTSHVGKSTTAQALADRLGWPSISTDSLARHPGRPWRPGGASSPEHVVEHYLTLGTDQLISSVLTHYEGMRPMIRDLIRRHATDPAAGPLVLEGSALWPASVASFDVPGVRALWLTAPPALVEARMHAESGYAERDAEGRRLIDNFLARTKRYDELMMKAVRELGLPFIEVGEGETAEALAERCEQLMRKAPPP